MKKIFVFLLKMLIFGILSGVGWSLAVISRWFLFAGRVVVLKC
jgi:hypothetical protein